LPVYSPPRPEGVPYKVETFPQPLASPGIISDIIRSIQETDKRIEASIVARTDTLLDEIKSLKKGQNAVKRYGGGSEKISRFLDRKS
jgi:hypothetical protein